MNRVHVVPVAVVALVTTGICADTVSVRVAVPVPALFVAVSVIVFVPAAIGVPEIRPVDVLTDTPAGKPVAP